MRQKPGKKKGLLRRRWNVINRERTQGTGGKGEKRKGKARSRRERATAVSS